MTDRELMQQALEAMEEACEIVGVAWAWRDEKGRPAITALRERLAQPQMQPCAGRNCGSTNPNQHSAECFEDYEKSTGMNQWQGLTDDEVFKILDNVLGFNTSFGLETNFVRAFARAVEQALKEKNT